MALVVDDVEVEHRAVAVGQFAHEAVEHVGGYAFGLQVGVGHVVWQVGYVYEVEPATGAQKLQRLVERNLRHPAPQRSLAAILEGGYRGEYPKERLLQNVFYVLIIGEIARAQGRQIAHVEPVERLRGRRVALLHTLQQALLAIRLVK